ncbi:hypothetical protein K4R76_11745 [Staphylococcus epidermidis]|nr:hypothetical protein [Staphylococcus epidermidis]
MEHVFDESLTEEEKEHYRHDFLDSYKPNEFNSILYKLLNYDEKENVIYSEKYIQYFEESHKENGDMMDLADMQQAKGELQEFEEDRMEAYHDYV